MFPAELIYSDRNMATDPDQFSGDRPSIKPPEEELAAPDLGADREDPDQWVVVAKNRRVNRDWLELVQRYPDNAKRCYKFLRTHPTQRVRGRVFPLKGKKYKGAWEYEIASGDRVFYVPDQEMKKVRVFYAGEHPKKTPEP